MAARVASALTASLRAASPAITPSTSPAATDVERTLCARLMAAAAAIGVGAIGLRAVGAVLGDREPLLESIAIPWQAGVAGVIAGLVAGLRGGLIPAVRDPGRTRRPHPDRHGDEGVRGRCQAGG